MEEYPEGKQYQLIVPMDESPISVQDVIAMYDAMMVQNVEEEREKIRSTVEKEADIRAVMKPAADFYKSFDEVRE